jgi:imidazoleglycerol-phosphate dehydratase
MARQGSYQRDTRESKVSVEWELDGTGQADVATGIGFLDHMLDSLARHGRFDLRVRAEGDLHVDQHHTTEDVAICLGRALAVALGERTGIRRFGDATVPLDEALATVAVDLSGRGYAVVDAQLRGEQIGTFKAEMLTHLLESFAIEARISLHARVLVGRNDHHKAEAVFKALARALDDATLVDARISGQVPSTKGSLT